MDCLPVTFAFLTPLSREALTCSLADEQPTLTSSDEVIDEDYFDFGLPIDESPVACYLSAIEWSCCCHKVLGTFFLRGHDRHSSLQEAVRRWIDSDQVALYKFLRTGSGGIIPVARIVPEGEVIGIGGYYGCNIVPRGPGLNAGRPLSEGLLAASFFFYLDERAVFCSPPLVISCTEETSAVEALQLLSVCVSKNVCSQQHFQSHCVYGIDTSEDGFNLLPLGGGPLANKNIAVCLGRITMGCPATLVLSQTSVLTYVVGVTHEEGLFSVSVSTLSNDATFQKPWIFDLLF